jgi:hypothetical protein
MEGRPVCFHWPGAAGRAAAAVQQGDHVLPPTYDILLHAGNVGGLKPSAQVLMSGVQVGTVSAMHTCPDGKSVTITLRIYRQYKIHKDARFVIEQSGFLGDQYVAILPTKNEGPKFKSGDKAEAEAPLDLQEVARSAAASSSTSIQPPQISTTPWARLRRTILSARALTNLSTDVRQPPSFPNGPWRSWITWTRSWRATPGPSDCVGKQPLFFSEQINRSASALRELLATNSPEIGAAVKNIESSTKR